MKIGEDFILYAARYISYVAINIAEIIKYKRIDIPFSFAVLYELY